MPVQELEDLAQWFKHNVLDSHNASPGSKGFNIDGAFESAATSANSEAAKPSEEDDALSLLEYIIGVS